MKQSSVLGLLAVVIVVGGVGYMVFNARHTPAANGTIMNAQQAATPSTDSGTPPKGDGEAKKPMMMQPQPPTPITDAQTAQVKAGAAPHQPTTLTFDINGGSFFFVPNEIHVKKGDTVKINFTNVGGFHDFTLDEFNVKIGPTQGGETKSAQFVADKTGTFEFYCSVGKHRQLGQKGTLYVE